MRQCSISILQTLWNVVQRHGIPDIYFFPSPTKPISSNPPYLFPSRPSPYPPLTLSDRLPKDLSWKEVPVVSAF